MTFVASDVTDEPVVGVLRLTSDRDVLTWFSLDDLRVVPVYCDVLDELEGIHVLLIHLG